MPIILLGGRHSENLPWRSYYTSEIIPRRSPFRVFFPGGRYSETFPRPSPFRDFFPGGRGYYRKTLWRGTIVNRTYGTHKTFVFTYFYEQYLVPFTGVPRNKITHPLERFPQADFLDNREGVLSTTSEAFYGNVSTRSFQKHVLEKLQLSNLSQGMRHLITRAIYTVLHYHPSVIR